GILHRQHVIIARFGIDPVAGRDHLVGVERGNYVVDHFAGGESEAGGHLAVDVNFEGGIVEVLRDEDVAYTFHTANLCCQLLGCLVGGLQIVAANLDVDWGGKAEVDDGVD